ncbi:hypothetical protein ACROYT_G007029 [Oculina patagonica]
MKSTTSAPPPPSPECEKKKPFMPPPDVEQKDVKPQLSDEICTPLAASFAMTTCFATTSIETTPISTFKITCTSVGSTCTPVSIVKSYRGCTSDFAQAVVSAFNDSSPLAPAPVTQGREANIFSRDNPLSSAEVPDGAFVVKFRWARKAKIFVSEVPPETCGESCGKFVVLWRSSRTLPTENLSEEPLQRREGIISAPASSWGTTIPQIPSAIPENCSTADTAIDSMPNCKLLAKLVKEILSGEFMKLSNLLPKNFYRLNPSQDEPLTLTLENAVIQVNKAKATSITDIAEWMMVDGNVGLILHQYCPEGETSWCGWQRDQAIESNDYKHKPPLTPAVDEVIKPTFKALSADELLERCFEGATHIRMSL